MSIFIFDRREEFVGLGNVPGQDWLTFRPEELRLTLFHPRFLLLLVSLLGEQLSLMKARGVITDAWEIIRDALRKMSGVPETPALLHIIRALQELKFPDSRPNYLQSALVELKALNRSTLGKAFSPARSDMLQKILDENRHVVIDTRGLSDKYRRLLIGYVFLYALEVGTTKGNPAYFLVDEVQPILTSQTDSEALTTLRNSIILGRGSGVHLIAAAQMAHKLDDVLLASCAHLICTGLYDFRNLQATAGAFGFPPQGSSLNLLQNLGQEEAIFRSSGRPGPLRIQVPEAVLPTGINEKQRLGEIKKFLGGCDIDEGPLWKDIKAHISGAAVKGASGKSKAPDPKDNKVLKLVASRHKSPVRLVELARSLGTSPVATSRKLDRLQWRGLLRRQSLYIGRDRATFAELSAEGFKKIGARPPSGGGRGGPAHRGMLGMLESNFKSKGFAVKREVEVAGKRIDLIATRGATRRILVELELSGEHTEINAEKCESVARKNDEVIFVTPTKKLLKRVRRRALNAVSNIAIEFYAFNDLMRGGIS